ncbi:olfactory receptor 13F1-like [Discoglossus pictus]
MNSTSPKEFHLMVFFSSGEPRLLLFIGVLFMYLLAMLGNLLIISLVCLVSQLHTPMYFFLCNVSVQDIMYVSSVLPELLTIIIKADNRISFSGCMAQIFLFAVCLVTEFFLLTSMAYDRYVAICIPLRYSVIMNKRVCSILAAAPWLFGFLNSLMFTLLMSNLSFCNLSDINHFFCDAQTIVKLACGDTTCLRIFIPVECVLLGWIPFMLIMISYLHIISTILTIKTSAGRLKAFSTCSSHLVVVILFYGTSLSLNMKSRSDHSQETDKLLSVLYIAVVPILNPLVYSLRNKDVLKALNKCLHFII